MDYLAEYGATHLRDRHFHDAFYAEFGGKRRADGDGIPVQMAMFRMRHMARRGLLDCQWVNAPERRRMEFRLSARLRAAASE